MAFLHHDSPVYQVREAPSAHAEPAAGLVAGEGTVACSARKAARCWDAGAAAAALEYLLRSQTIV